jgi:hypothetical protein
MKNFIIAIASFLLCYIAWKYYTKKKYDGYLTKMIQLTNVLDSLVGQNDTVNCDKLTNEITISVEEIFKNDSLLYSVSVELHDVDNFNDKKFLKACGGGCAKFWEHPKEIPQWRLNYTNSKHFNTKLFGRCFFNRKEGSIAPWIKNGIEYSHVLILSLEYEEKYKFKYYPQVDLQILFPSGGDY